MRILNRVVLIFFAKHTTRDFIHWFICMKVLSLWQWLYWELMRTGKMSDIIIGNTKWVCLAIYDKVEKSTDVAIWSDTIVECRQDAEVNVTVSDFSLLYNISLPTYSSIIKICGNCVRNGQHSEWVWFMYWQSLILFRIWCIMHSWILYTNENIHS